MGSCCAVLMGGLRLAALVPRAAPRCGVSAWEWWGSNGAVLARVHLSCLDADQLPFKVRASGMLGEISLPKALSQDLNVFRCLLLMKFYIVLVVEKKRHGCFVTLAKGAEWWLLLFDKERIGKLSWLGSVLCGGHVKWDNACAIGCLYLHQLALTCLRIPTKTWGGMSISKSWCILASLLPGETISQPLIIRSSTKQRTSGACNAHSKTLSVYTASRGSALLRSLPSQRGEGPA